jgi:RNA polymerase sigma-70 factor (ECF subfamily)
MITFVDNRDQADASSIQTRASLLGRLRAGDDAVSWREFYEMYGGLIRSFAIKSGLTVDEAEEVVQETAIGVARGLPKYVYDPEVCRFKTWLLNLTRWRITDQLRRRDVAASRQQTRSEDADRTATIERVSDPNVPEFGNDWDTAWEKNLVGRALERLKDRISERDYQIFDLNVTKGWSAAEVARTLRVSAARVYLTKHRVTTQIRREVRRLERRRGV